MRHQFSLFCLFLLLSSSAWAQEVRWSLVIHGGAGANTATMTQEQIEDAHRVLGQALKLGKDHLTQGGQAIDCVELVVRHLEDSPEFNAGRGAVYNSRGEHELDASVMDGRDRSCGAVAGVQTVKNPVSLARLVKEKTRHVLLAGSGAEAFATSMNVVRVDNSYFDTERRFQDWQKKKAYSKGTVGCVALDIQGNLAAATSTGGLTNKKWGRVGDSPVIGAGCYADNRSCAISGTGTGEEYIRRALAHDVSARMLYGDKSLYEAGEEALDSLPDNCGGLIGVDKDGDVIMLFNTPGMARGVSTSAGRFEVKLGKD